jgi:exo-beta-1,3-glucanase (GH17 family)
MQGAKTRTELLLAFHAGQCGTIGRAVSVLSWVRVCLACLLAMAWTGACAAQAAPPAACHRDAATSAGLARLQAALASDRFITYEPTAIKVINGAETSADPASIRADLTVLRSRFDALVTYEAVHGEQQIPQIAAALGYRALIIGVWNPFDEAETQAALTAARTWPQLVVGVSLGNELLFGKPAESARLAARLAALHAREPRLPLSSSEPFHVYTGPAGAPVLGQLDFLLPNVHPVFQPWFHGAGAPTSAQFVVNVAADLAARFCGPILVKETGVPTAPPGADFSEAAQAAFYAELRRRLLPDRQRAFAYFGAFDAPWRAFDVTPVGPAHAEEAFWGLYDAQRKPKAAARELPPLTTSPPVPP